MKEITILSGFYPEPELAKGEYIEEITSYGSNIFLVVRTPDVETKQGTVRTVRTYRRTHIYGPSLNMVGSYEQRREWTYDEANSNPCCESKCCSTVPQVKPEGFVTTQVSDPQMTLPFDVAGCTAG